VEGEAEHLDVEVNGVAGEVAFGPAPIAVLDDETGIPGPALVGLASAQAFILRAFSPGRALTQRFQRWFLLAGALSA